MLSVVHLLPCWVSLCWMWLCKAQDASKWPLNDLNMSMLYHAERHISIDMPSVIMQNVVMLFVVAPCITKTLIPRLSLFISFRPCRRTTPSPTTSTSSTSTATPTSTQELKSGKDPMSRVTQFVHFKDLPNKFLIIWISMWYQFIWRWLARTGDL